MAKSKKTKIHKKIDGQILQMNKQFSNLKMKQKDKITEWVYEEYKKYVTEHDKVPDLLADEQIVEAVLDKINEAQIWIPDGEIYDYYRRKKPQLQKRLDNEKVIKFKSYVSFYKSIVDQDRASVVICQKWVSVAACFVLVVVIGVGVFQSNLFGTKNDIATLDGGETITFVKNDLSQSSINLNVTTRPLSNAEIEMLFADLPVTADAYFDADNHNILGFEGKISDTRMVVSKQGVNLLDTIIDGNTITSSVDGVDIDAGYFVTKSNSQGIKTVIYYATFDMGENTIYVEYSGVENESETVKNNLVDTILKLIENGAFDLSQIQE